MRSVFLLAVSILLTSSFFTMGSNPDSLLQPRNSQLQEIQNYKSAMADSSTESLLPLLQKMNALIDKDNELFETFKTEMALQDTAIAQAETVSAELEMAKTELATYEEYKQYVMIGGGALVFILLLIIIMQSSSKGKLKKKLKKQNKTIHEAEELETKVLKLEENLTAATKDHNLATEKAKKDHEQELSKKDAEIETLKKDAGQNKNAAEEIQKLKASVAEKDTEIRNLQSEIEKEKRNQANATAETDRLKQQLAGINDRQVSDLEEKEKLIKDLQEELARAKRSNNELELEMFQVRNNLKSSDSSEEVSKLKEDLERAEKELNDSRESLIKEIEALKIENEEIRQRLETEVSIREEFAAKQNNSEELSSSIDSSDMEQLKKELAEERQLRLEMQQLMEQLLKKD